MKYILILLSLMFVSCKKIDDLAPKFKGFKNFELHVQTKNATARLDINGEVQIIGDTSKHSLHVFIIEHIDYIWLDKLKGDKMSVSLETNVHRGRNYGWVEGLMLYGKNVEFMK